jgi:hypothetical protein
MLLEKSVQAQFLIPMAVSLGFGVLFSTLITLFLVPCGFMIHKDILGIVGRFRSLLLPPPSGASDLSVSTDGSEKDSSSLTS